MPFYSIASSASDRNRAPAFGGPEVDHQSKLARLLDRQIPGSETTEDFRD